MVVTQTAGPTNGGGTSRRDPAVVRELDGDPDRRRAVDYSLITPRRAARAADGQRPGGGPHVSVGPSTPAIPGGFTVTLKLADLSTAPSRTR